MGYGDQLLAAGLAEARYAQDPSAGPVTITDLHGTPRWQPLWQGNPAISVTRDGPRLACGAGCLPYLVYPRLPDRLTFVSPETYRAQDHRGHLYLTEDEIAIGQSVFARYGPYIVVEPFPRDRKNINRQWPLASWELLIGLLQRYTSLSIVQADHPHATRTSGLAGISTPTFRDACGLYASATLVIALEGGVPFATAALNVPTIVLWGGCISAPILSYPEQVNLVDDQSATPCGMLVPCEHCTRAWLRLTPEYVAQVARSALRSPSRGVA